MQCKSVMAGETDAEDETTHIQEFVEQLIEFSFQKIMENLGVFIKSQHWR